MVKEAEDNAEEDRQARENIEAKNQLESYLYSLKTSVQDSLKDKVSAEDKEKLLSIVNETSTWLESHLTESKDTYDGKRKSVEEVANPIMTRAYSANKSSGSAADSDDQNNSSNDNQSEPSVEEVD
jgi:molecular chaperone DnaK (HSP70)